MKQNEKIAICLAGGLMLTASTRAVTADAQGNPYQSVVERNVFALKPAPRPEDNPPPKPPTPPIELQGITSMFGRKQVLFAAVMPGSKPGEPAKRTPMVLSVGEREGEIEVLEIDEAAGTVKFNNHGTEEIKDLAKDSAKPAPSPVAAPFPGISAPRVPGVAPARMGAHNSVPPAPTAGGSMTTFGSSAGVGGSTLKNIPTRTVRGPTSAAGGVPVQGFGGGVPAQGFTGGAATAQPAQPKPLTPQEQRDIMILENVVDPSGPPLLPGMHEE